MAEEDLFLDLMLEHQNKNKTSTSTPTTPTTSSSQTTKSIQDEKKALEDKFFQSIKSKDDEIEIEKMLRDFPDLIDVKKR